MKTKTNSSGLFLFAFVDQQGKKLHKLFQIFFIFMSLVFLALSQSPHLQRRHCWVAVMFLSLAHLIFCLSVAQTRRCINGFRYQRRCHKPTLGLATKKLREMKLRLSNNINDGGGIDYDGVVEDKVDIHYQEPPESSFGKFKAELGSLCQVLFHLENLKTQIK